MSNKRHHNIHSPPSLLHVSCFEAVSPASISTNG